MKSVKLIIVSLFMLPSVALAIPAAEVYWEMCGKQRKELEAQGVTFSTTGGIHIGCFQGLTSAREALSAEDYQRIMNGGQGAKLLQKGIMKAKLQWDKLTDTQDDRADDSIAAIPVIVAAIIEIVVWEGISYLLNQGEAEWIEAEDGTIYAKYLDQCLDNEGRTIYPSYYESKFGDKILLDTVIECEDISPEEYEELVGE